MKNPLQLMGQICPLAATAVSTVVFTMAMTGCRSGLSQAGMAVHPAAVAAPAPGAPAAPATPSKPIPVPGPPAMHPEATKIIRIDAGAASSHTDAAGHVWLADQGFSGGQTAARPHDLPIANTADPEIYRTEHFGMRSFSWKLPNGRYIVKLFFAETYDQAAGPGKRVFSFDVNGAGFMGFDVYALARGRDRAVTQTVYVDVTNGELTITFTPQVQQPEINGIEIVSQR